jgi:hypothetical protein
MNHERTFDALREPASNTSKDMKGKQREMSDEENILEISNALRQRYTQQALVSQDQVQRPAPLVQETKYVYNNKRARISLSKQLADLCGKPPVFQKKKRKIGGMMRMMLRGLLSRIWRSLGRIHPC